MGFDLLDKPRKYVLMGSLFWWLGERISDIKLIFLVGLDCFNGLGNWLLPKSHFWEFEEGVRSEKVEDLESGGFTEEDDGIWVEIRWDSGVMCVGDESRVRK